MCTYCNNTVVNLPFLNVLLDLGIVGKAEQSIYIFNSDKGSYINFEMESYGLGGSSIKKVTKINYCPMCGRKLQPD